MDQSWFNAFSQILGGLFSLSTLTLGALGGCLATQPGCQSAPGFPKEFGQVTQAFGTSIATQAQWEKIVAGAHGQVIEPGYEVYGGVLYVAGVKFKGFSGAVDFQADGTGSGQVSPEVQAAIIRAFQGDEQARAFVLDLIKTGRLTVETSTTQPGSPE